MTGVKSLEGYGLNMTEIIMADRRELKRLTLGNPPTLVCRGEDCLLVDISLSGLGMTFICNEGWPANLMLEYSLPKESGRKRLVHCRTVWESTLDFHISGFVKTVRRRGLEFVDSGSEDVDKLHHHLESRTVTR
jgi:hypothetical protein